MADDVRSSRIQRGSGLLLMATLCVVLALPPLLTIALRLIPGDWAKAIVSVQLSDNARAQTRPPLTWSGWRRAEFQPRFEQWFTSSLAPRAAIIRTTNQVYYSLFRRSPAGFIIGRDEYVFHPDYARVYCEAHQRDILAHLAPLVIKVSQLQAELQRRGTPLVFVVSPSKTAVMSEFLPAGLCSKASRVSADTRTLVALLRAAGISVVDGPDLIEQMKARDPLPPFPRGGLHWSVFAGKRVASVFLDEANRTAGSQFGTMTFGEPRWDLPANGRDTDLAVLLNLSRPPLDFPTANATSQCHTTPIGKKTRLIAVGGSFLGVIFDALAECKFFDVISEYFYYTQYHFQWPNSLSPVNRSKLDWPKLLEPPTLLVIELNDLYVEQDFPHLHEFLDDALRAFRH